MIFLKHQESSYKLPLCEISDVLAVRKFIYREESGGKKESDSIWINWLGNIKIDAHTCSSLVKTYDAVYLIMIVSVHFVAERLN